MHHNYHFLAIGHYAAKDLNDLGFFRGRSWQYGYFIDLPAYQARPNREYLELLWCARLSEVKQPSMALDIAQGLHGRGLKVRLTMVGDGVLRSTIENDIKRRAMTEMVRLTGWQTQDEVRDHMGNADLFLMTSHHGEGWGLVVNEALSYGCGVVANQELGSAACLVEDGKSGILYSDENIELKLDGLANLGRESILSMGQAGYENMKQNWSSNVAAQRTIKLANCLLDSGPSKAKKLFHHGIASAI